jgi:hypothetical protein
MKPFSRMTYVVEIHSTEPEAQQLNMQIFSALRRAGWRPGAMASDINIGAESPIFGVKILVNQSILSDSGYSQMVADKMMQEFKKNSIDSNIENSTEELAPYTIQIAVFSKPLYNPTKNK